MGRHLRHTARRMGRRRCLPYQRWWCSGGQRLWTIWLYKDKAFLDVGSSKESQNKAAQAIRGTAHFMQGTAQSDNQKSKLGGLARQ